MDLCNLPFEGSTALAGRGVHIAKRTENPDLRNHQSGGFWILLTAQKYRGKILILTNISDFTFKEAMEDFSSPIL